MTSKKHLHFLPEEIIVNILCRLPVKSLNRFRCVSKLWHSIISDPEFAKSHFELACKQGTLTQRFLTTRLLISDFSSYPLQSIDPEAALFGDVSSVRNLTFPTHESKQQPERIFLLGSCNGLVFISLDGYNNLCIWNPSNRSVQKLPSPDFMTCACENLQRILVFFMYGLGYVSGTDDYKLLVAAELDPDDEYANDVVMEMFSLRANSWKSIQYPESVVGPEMLYSAIHNHLGALTNEALHWVYCSDDNEPSILAFDLAREEFRLMPLPLPFSVEDDDTDDSYVDFESMGIQVLSGGCLCVSFLRMDCIEFWVMIEYEVLESWTKLFDFNIDDLPVSYYWYLNGKKWYLYGKEPIFITESGTVLLLCGAKGDDKELIRIECNKEEELLVCSNLYSLEKMPGIVYDVIQYVIQYDETLLTLPLIK